MGWLKVKDQVIEIDGMEFSHIRIEGPYIQAWFIGPEISRKSQFGTEFYRPYRRLNFNIDGQLIAVVESEEWQHREEPSSAKKNKLWPWRKRG